MVKAPILSQTLPSSSASLSPINKNQSTVLTIVKEEQQVELEQENNNKNENLNNFQKINTCNPFDDENAIEKDLFRENNQNSNINSSNNNNNIELNYHFDHINKINTTMANSESIAISSSTSESSVKENESEIESCDETGRYLNDSNVVMIKNTNTVTVTTSISSSSSSTEINDNNDVNNINDDSSGNNNRNNNYNDESNNNPSINKTLPPLSEIETIVTNSSIDDNECSVYNTIGNVNQNENVIVTAPTVGVMSTTTTKNELRVVTTTTTTAVSIGTKTVPCTFISTPSTSSPIIFGVNQQNSIQTPTILATTTPITTLAPSNLQQPPSIPPPPTLIALSPITVSQIPQLSPPIQHSPVPQPPPVVSGPQQQPPMSAHSPSLHGSHPAAPPPPPHHHIFPVHVISIPQPPPGSAAVTGAWPIMEAPIYVDSNGEARPYCPAHSQGPGPREHRVLLQLDTGVSLPLQMTGGKRKIFRENTRGRYSTNMSKETNKNCPTTVQMVSQNRPPPIPVPVQVPQGQVMQQYVNESGTLTHVVLSPTQYQQLHAGQGGVPHIHAPFITTNGTTSHFYGPLPAGFPGPGGGPHFHPMPGGHLPPQQMSHSPHSPSPPNNYHKDERTQRQHTKLLRKLDQKREMNSAMSTPAHSPSPRKSDLNGMRRTSRNGASSVGTSEDGEESSSVPDEEDDCQTIIEQLSAVQKPEVTDITSRSAMVRWEAPPMTENLINSRELRYDVLLSDRGKEGKYKKILEYGESYVCMIRDLRPGQEYFVCLQVHYEKLVGSASEPAVFTTPPCEPDQPLSPKLIARTKNSLQLRWNAPTDNGSHITNYVLEYDEGKGKEFVEIIKTKGKQYTLTKLQPSTQYRFRLAAINECGPSIYSDMISYSTSGNPPLAPKPPTLQSATSNSLRLAWEKRPQDEEFVLQMADRESGHGFLNMYNGIETSYECKGLKRATSYQFRLRADNEAGPSPWSNDVTYKTYTERPGRPSKPQIKGKIHGTYFKAKWDPPNDRGGGEIRKYFLEISSGAKFERIYTGSEPEALCDRLSPGTTYQIRVSCEGPGGISGYSDVCTVTTEGVVPGAPDPPFCGNPPSPYAVVMRWDVPDYSGGAPILEFELKLNGPNHENEIVYRGKEFYCVVKDLVPGEEYQAYVRAVNRIGAGAWSKAFVFSCSAAPPFPPVAPEVLVRSATHLTVSWKEPVTNGAPITEYRLESSVSANTDPLTTNDTFNICYQGIQTSTDIRNLIPFTFYYFRLCASNVAGTSPYSQIVSTQTPAAAPAAPQIKNYEITATEVTLSWSQPESHGSDILCYVIEYGDKSVTTEENVTEYTITNLASETSYKFKVQAVNEIGAGQFSNPLKLTTLPPPPDPPKLECTGVGHNFIKLKWGEGKNLDFVNYYVEMYNTRAKEFQIVYSGTNLMCKVNKLQEQTSYVFRICAETDRAGTGEYSEEYIFKTSATLPSNIKPPRIVDTNLNMSCCSSIGNHHITNHNNNNTNSISNSNSSGHANALNPAGNGSHNTVTGIVGAPAGHNVHCFNSNILTIEWQHSKNSFADPIEYILQYSCGKENDYIEIYRGSETKYTIENLEPGLVYLFRVCPIRVTTTNGDLMGSFTPPLRYQVPQLHRTSIDCTDAAAMLSSSSSVNHHRSSHHHNHHFHHHHVSGGVCSDTSLHTSDGDCVMTKGNMINNPNNNNTANGGSIVRRGFSKITSIYTSRKRLNDQEKAMLWMLSFILATICFSAIVKMFIS